MSEKKIKVAVAMSGGVDSSACAVILKNENKDVFGLTLKLFDRCENNKKCGTDEEIKDAKKVCEKLNISHYVFDCREEFKESVIEKFVSDYENGLTPNPCVNCNRDIKFKNVLSNALNLGADFIATGHYANIVYDEDKKRYLLKKAADEKKDQTYFLYKLTQYELAHTLFPLGNYKDKSSVREIAGEFIPEVSEKKDSQDVCFISEKSYVDFLEKYRGKKYEEGNFVDKDGNILAKHRGIVNYTVGQRKGLGVSFCKPMYVIEKRKDKNEVVLGDEADLYSDSLIIKNINLISVESIKEPMTVKAKTRYNQIPVDAVVYEIEKDTIKVKFKTPVKAVTKGQACVFYDGDTVVGGGTII